ncbi:MAG: TIGR03986 family CRISPR-associated RAMP protein [Oscillibacter sp.]|nr:TIGR03986 family CRISPR-associated RAMP protein [Oscillibacter sp.]
MGKKGKKCATEQRTAVPVSRGTDALPSVGRNNSAGTDEKNDNHPGQGKTWAPYNFVPFSNKVLLPYPGGLDSLPGHDEIRPDLKTGEIQITLTAETPVFVSDGQRGNASFFRGANGKLMIPGSTIRGLVRGNLQILGFGLIRPGEDLEDRRIYFREMASGSRTLGADLKEGYKKALDIVSETKKQKKGTISVPHKVMAGYIRLEGGKYCIYPTKGNRYIRISRNNVKPESFREKYAAVLPVTYTGEGKNVRLFPPDSSGGENETVRNGMLLFTGKWVGPLANSLYLFPEMDRDGETVPISDEDILSYRADYEDRKNSLKAYYDVKFWDLPEEGICKPVFYARVDGHTYFGMSLFLRIGYRHTIAEGLPAYHRDRNQQQEEQVDYPHGILGFSNQANSYRSRVSVEDFTLTASGDAIQEIPYTPGGPKPSFYPGYLRDAPRNPYSLPPVSVKARNYNDHTFLLRGYKQYWLRDTAMTPLPPKRVDAASTVKLRLLPAGAVFTGVIRYKNLTEQELGLLLWSIRLDDSCYHSIGMGKPYGFGRMKVQIQNLLEVQPAQLYGGLAGPSPVLRGTETTAERVDGYIKRYDERAEKLLESLEDTLKLPVTETDSIRNRPEIQDFLYMKSTLVQSAEGDGESLYMSIDKGDYRNLTKPIPTVAELRQTEAAAEEAANRSMDDWLAALKAKAASGRL